ncbi:MAG TPA: rhodanese-like domain-containing protein [Candidatus Eisenbacteria bacterium]|nr:rhodanese-like domain-containing protein [Candidatus Eisenbacteria bacterium]
MIEYRVSPTRAKAQLDNGEAIALDVTSSLVYPAVNGRIPGAIRVPPEPILRGMARRAPVSDVMAHFPALPDGRAILAYCT